MAKEDGAGRKRPRKRADRYNILNYYIVLSVLLPIILLLLLILLF